jgi:hypothetical protein
LGLVVSDEGKQFCNVDTWRATLNSVDMEAVTPPMSDMSMELMMFSMLSMF